MLKKITLILSLFLFQHSLFGQNGSLYSEGPDTVATLIIPDSIYNLYRPLSFESISLSPVIFSYDQYIYHSSDAEDSLVADQYFSLINAEPTAENHEQYYRLALALWNLERTEEAEKMFLKIYASKEPDYNTTYKYGSDIPGDTTQNIYGYGSYTFRYKYTACIYLTKIYVERKEYKRALKYLDESQKKYPVQYNCGTGYRMEHNEIYGLYGMIYEGLQEDDKIINLFMPECFEYPNDYLPDAIKRKYSPEQIKKELDKAERNCRFVDNSKNKRIDPDLYGYRINTCSTKLFGCKVNLPYPNIAENSDATKEQYLEEFRASYLYESLID